MKDYRQRNREITSKQANERGRGEREREGGGRRVGARKTTRQKDSTVSQKKMQSGDQM